MRFDVVVVGGGITGLSCALGLAKYGFTIGVVEAKPQGAQPSLPASSFDTKVVAITRASEYFLDYLGVWAAIKSNRCSEYHHMKVWDNVMDGLIEFSAVDFLEDNLGYIVEQQVIIHALCQAITQQPNIKILNECVVENMNFVNDLNSLALSNKMMIQAPLVIAADGANSSIREKCGIQTAGWEYQQSAIVATIRGTKSHHFTAYQRFAIDGPLALLPLADPFQCSIVWTTTALNAKTLLSLAPSDFVKVLTRESSGVIGDVSLASQVLIFPLKTHHAKQYAVAGCVLVGDAAHTIHPLAGQGVNLGLLDVAALIELLAQHRRKGIGSLALLKRYERQRKMHNQMMIWAMELFKQGFSATSPVIQRIRNIGLNLVNKHQVVKQFFVSMALGTRGPIPGLALKNHERMHHDKKDAFI